jgi:acyl-CoA synthetase (AMP-forming)/AMP-acid ligase II
MDTLLNVGRRLTLMAQARPDAPAVVEPLGYDAQGKRLYRQVTFCQLDQDSDRIARGLRALGVAPGTRLALLVRPGIDFISLVFAMYKAAAVAILIDPGMGRRHLIRCLAEAEPEGFVAIPIVHAVRSLLPWRFPKARFNVTVGRRWFWGGVTLGQLRGGPWSGSELAPTTADQPAAIIFTTGSTGPPKGVLYTHGNFDAQVEQIREFYGIQPGEVDLPAFPLFGLFNCAMGVTAVIPDMDPSRPAAVDPSKIIEAATDWNVTQAFGSPAIWDRVGRYCEAHGVRLPTIRRVLSAGAPVPAEVLRRMKACIHPEGDIHTPYGATEALPVASTSASEVLGARAEVVSPLPLGEGSGVRAPETKPGSAAPPSQVALTLALSQKERGLSASEPGTAEKTRAGGGVCVGRTFSDIQWKVIRIVDGPISSLDVAEELPPGDIGELIVCGPQVTRQYVTRTEWNARAKIADGAQVWHRMGDSGYLDEKGRFWFCGRVAHRVCTVDGPMYPIRCEAIFNQHPDIRRSALVGVGPPGRQRPVIILEPYAGRTPVGPAAKDALLAEIRQLAAANPLTAEISDFLLHPSFPVDIRHNVKIFREKLAVWAAGQVRYPVDG